MSRYTIRGSAELDARIDADLARIAKVASPCSIAGILLGGYGRGEGTPFIHPDGTHSPFNDYDLVVIVDKPDREVRHLFKAYAQQLSAGLGLPVDLCVYDKNRLPHCESSLLNYEMKHGHKVVWGDEHILDAMPDYPVSDIPLSEGARLLLNRGKLLLDIKLRLAEGQALSEEEKIRFIKFIYKVWLAIGDCVLLAERSYDLSYRIKRERIASIGDIPHRDVIVEKYCDAVDLKEWGDYPARLDADLAESFCAVRDLFREFFPWYRAHHAGPECSMIKALLLNLKWNARPLPQHPRTYLYDALQELLKDEPSEYRLREMMFTRDNFTERFYAMQQRFS